MSHHSTTDNMDDAAVIFRGTAPLESFRQFSARDPRFSSCSVNPTARQQEYESYKAEYTETLFHTMVARCPHLTFQQARSHFDLLRARGKLEFLGVRPQHRNLVPPSQTGGPAVQASRDALPVQGGSSAVQTTTARMHSANAATGISSRDVVAQVGSQNQSTTTTPDRTASSIPPQHGALRGHNTRSRSVGGVEGYSNRRHSADGELVPRSRKDDELAQRYRSTAEATSMFLPPPIRLSPTAPEFFPRTPQAGPASSAGTNPPTSGSSSTTEGRARPRRKDSWEDDEYLAGGD
ncbi:hypothetical protein MMC17_005902 [Xylographa soralifera]|nr:hypothetical protein [Xylographa soralifera]